MMIVMTVCLCLCLDDYHSPSAVTRKTGPCSHCSFHDNAHWLRRKRWRTSMLALPLAFLSQSRQSVAKAVHEIAKHHFNADHAWHLVWSKKLPVLSCILPHMPVVCLPSFTSLAYDILLLARSSLLLLLPIEMLNRKLQGTAPCGHLARSSSWLV
eukprot:767761-Hanusia_phi.AAC.5